MGAPEVVPVQVGSRKVELRIETNRPGGLRYLNLHENESVSVAAAREVLRSHAGKLILLQTDRKQRTVDFRLDGKTYEFDPNRMFSDDGLEASLLKYGKIYSDQARDEVHRLRNAVLAALAGEKAKPVVALHNNTTGGFSVLSYVAPGDEAKNARAHSIDTQEDPNDFFLVTSQSLFNHLRDRKFNVVLQSLTPFDDGSLSVWFQKQGRPYVNVEAFHDGSDHPAHFTQQQKMLEEIANVCSLGNC